MTRHRDTPIPEALSQNRLLCQVLQPLLHVFASGILAAQHHYQVH